MRKVFVAQVNSDTFFIADCSAEVDTEDIISVSIKRVGQNAEPCLDDILDTSPIDWLTRHMGTWLRFSEWADNEDDANRVLRDFDGIAEHHQLIPKRA